MILDVSRDQNDSTFSDELARTIDAYDRSAHQFDEKIASLPNYRPSYETLSKLISPTGHILDLACGPGNISRFLVAESSLRQVTAIDLSGKMLEIARSYIPQGIFLQQSIVDFKLPSETPEVLSEFDAVVNGFGLPYLDSNAAEQCIAHAVRYLASGGAFYISFMNGNTVRSETPSFNQAVSLTVHYHDQKTIRKILESHGLSIQYHWNLDYKEADGSITTDVVFIARKEPINIG